MSSNATDAKTTPELIVPDPVEAMRKRGKQPELAGLLAWLLPGAGHIYAGHPIKGVGALILILGMFFAGVGISRGECVSLREPDGHRFAFMAQIGAGAPTFLSLAYSHGKLLGLRPGYQELLDHPDGFRSEAFADQLPRSDIGLLFTMIAGLLNLLLVHDALSGVPGALQRRIAEERKRRRLEALRKELGLPPFDEEEPAAATAESDNAEKSDADAAKADTEKADAEKADAEKADTEASDAETADAPTAKGATS